MIEEMLKFKLKLSNAIIDELPSQVQDKINSQKRDLLQSIINVLKNELEENKVYKKDDSKVKSISIE